MHRRRQASPRSALSAFLLLSLLAVPARSAVDPIRELVADQAVLVLSDDIETADWPLLLHLAAQGGTIDVVTAGDGLNLSLRTDTARFQAVRHLRAIFPARGQSRSLDSLVHVIRARAYPRTIILPGQQSPWMDSLLVRFRALDSRLLRPAVYRPVDTISRGNAEHAVITTPRAFAHDLAADYTLLAADFGLPALDQIPRYRFYLPLVADSEVSFLDAGSWRMKTVVQKNSRSGNDQIVRQFDSLMTGLTMAVGRPPKLRAEALLAGHAQFRRLSSAISNTKELMTDRGMRLYLSDREEAFSRAIQRELAVDCTADIASIVTPLDTAQVYRLVISNNGALPVTLQSIQMSSQTSTDRTETPLDSIGQMIPPLGQLLRQYKLPPADPGGTGVRLTATVTAGGEQLDIESSRTQGHEGSLRVSFDPPYLFVPPVARITEDRTAASHEWRIRIDKSPAMSGKAKLQFEPPRGLFAGAYRQEIELKEGLSSDWMTIPFSATNLFELGTQIASIELLRAGKIVSTDSGRIRIAECRVDKAGSIGFVPDTSGGLEDILRMTSATYEPLTDRTLSVGNLEAFRTLVIGSAANWHSPQVGKVRSRLDDYLRGGGTIVIFGQPSDWPENALPLPFRPQPLRMAGNQALVLKSDHRLLTTPYVISTDILLKNEPRERYVSAALGGAERIITAPTDEPLLAVASYGDGRIVFCGLPLTAMISRLNIEAIHFFANLLNY